MANLSRSRGRPVSCGGPSRSIITQTGGQWTRLRQRIIPPFGDHVRCGVTEPTMVSFSTWHGNRVIASTVINQPLFRCADPHRLHRAEEDIVCPRFNDLRDAAIEYDQGLVEYGRPGFQTVPVVAGEALFVRM